jgi:hypothetical protein
MEVHQRKRMKIKVINIKLLNMKTIFVAAFLCLIAYNNYAQTQQKDSLKIMLAHVASPREKFDIIRASLERSNTTQADNVDSASCIELLKIAQQERNDSMLAISYDWTGSYFAFTKGDNISAGKMCNQQNL